MFVGRRSCFLMLVARISCFCLLAVYLLVFVVSVVIGSLGLCFLGLCFLGLCFLGLCSYGLCSYGLCSFGFRSQPPGIRHKTNRVDSKSNRRTRRQPRETKGVAAKNTNNYPTSHQQLPQIWIHIVLWIWHIVLWIWHIVLWIWHLDMNGCFRIIWCCCKCVGRFMQLWVDLMLDLMLSLIKHSSKRLKEGGSHICIFSFILVLVCAFMCYP